MMKSLCLILFVVGLSSCNIAEQPLCADPPSESLWPDVDLALYENVPNLYDGTATTARNWSAVKPDPPVGYWELRRVDQHDTVIAKTGEKCKSASDFTACVAGFDMMRGNNGFATSSGSGVFSEHRPQGTLPMYVISNSGDKNELWDTLDELKLFLGKIDSQEEAIVMVHGKGYYGSNIHKENGAIREVNGEYEMIVLSFFRDRSSCRFPSREHIRVSPSGSIASLRTQTFPEPRN